MTAHTPGPWRYEIIESTLEILIVRPFDRDDNGRAIVDQPLFGDFRGCHIAKMAFTGSGVPTRDAAEANARLITAAPEILEALQMVVGSCRALDNEDTEALAAASRAIAKATGGPA